MKYLRTPKDVTDDAMTDEDPMSSVGNLFDISLVFIVALLVTLFSVTGLSELLDAKSNMTVAKESESGEIEIIRKEGKVIKAVKMDREESEGLGRRLGVAYELKDGTMIYVPEKNN